ncbi:MAG: FtsQ-type POTRA domain-containing protein [Lentisphaeria bacterium]|nr:FtsQ-type POTRA domain-containing protein [Lentisphaerota bacterium]MBR7144900.1 FtsQ-type POTRA domain-containing protein [Lentisphaeria bacterium]
MATVRKSKSPAGTNDPAVRQKKKKLIRGIVLLCILLIVMIGCVLGLYWLKNRMFEDNKRFTLRHVNIVSSGYWGKDSITARQLLNKLDLHIGKSNLFALQPEKLRRELRSIPNVEDARVRAVLPDTLEIKIEERTPRAFIGRPRSPLVVDANGVVMNAGECFGVHDNLPVINGGVHTTMSSGEVHTALRPALHLIMTVQRYKNFSVAAVSLRQPDNLVTLMDYRRGSMVRRYHVTMPRGNYTEWLDILQSAIEDAIRRGDGRNRINLTFKNQVVMSH